MWSLLHTIWVVTNIESERIQDENHTYKRRFPLWVACNTIDHESKRIKIAICFFPVIGKLDSIFSSSSILSYFSNIWCSIKSNIRFALSTFSLNFETLVWSTGNVIHMPLIHSFIYINSSKYFSRSHLVKKKHFEIFFKASFSFKTEDHASPGWKRSPLQNIWAWSQISNKRI